MAKTTPTPDEAREARDVVDHIVEQVIAEINIEAEGLPSSYKYPAQYLLEEVIKKLEASVYDTTKNSARHGALEDH